MHLSFFLYIIFSHIYSCFSLYLSFFVYCVHPNLCTSSSVSIYAGILIPIFISLCTRSCHYKIVVILGSTQGNHLSKFQLIRNSCFEVNRQQTNKQTYKQTDIQTHWPPLVFGCSTTNTLLTCTENATKIQSPMTLPFSLWWLTRILELERQIPQRLLFDFKIIRNCLSYMI